MHSLFFAQGLTRWYSGFRLWAPAHKPPQLLSQNQGTVFRDRNTVLKMGAVASIFGYRRPIIVQQPRSRATGIDHGLDGEHHTFLQASSVAANAKVWHLRLFMKMRPHFVPQQL